MKKEIYSITGILTGDMIYLLFLSILILYTIDTELTRSGFKENIFLSIFGITTIYIIFRYGYKQIKEFKKE